MATDRAVKDYGRYLRFSKINKIPKSSFLLSLQIKIFNLKIILY